MWFMIAGIIYSSSLTDLYHNAKHRKIGLMIILILIKKLICFEYFYIRICK